jgi:hypothetical protein
MVKPITWLPLRDMRNPVRSNLVSPSIPDSTMRFTQFFLASFVFQHLDIVNTCSHASRL